MTEFFLRGFCFQHELGRPGYLLQGVQETKLLRNIVELPHSIKDPAEVRYNGYPVAPFCKVIWVFPSSSQQFRESMEEEGQLDFPEKGFGAGVFLCRQQGKDSENVGKLMDSGGKSESKREQTGRRKKGSLGWTFQVILVDQ